MDLKHLFLAGAVALLATVGAQAQFGVYGYVATARYTGVVCQNSLGCSYNDGIDRTLGGGGGMYYDHWTLGPARIGVDLRGDILRSNKSASFDSSGQNAFRMDGILTGGRAKFSLHKDFLSPYAEVLVGWNRRDRADNFLAYRGVGGLDVNLLPIMSVRIPEISVGQNIGMGGVKSNTVESVSVGVVFHTRRN